MKRKDSVKSGNAKGIFFKRYLKSRPVCKVIFRLPGEAVPENCTVCLAGDFNGWNVGAAPMRRLRSGDYSITIDLATGRDYRFRYFIDGDRWENHWCADRYDPNPYGCDDSVVVV
jgi:1,4-alpha-glucan branching enzyme